MEYRPHPLADIFPLMTGEEFVALKADIKENGLLEPIWVLDGLLLDGRNRFRACQEVGVKPVFRDYEGDNPTAFVISLNLKRRHLNESQRGMVAAKLANMSVGRNWENNSANLQNKNVSQTQAAELLNVGTRTVASAKKVEEKGSPELVAAVEQGKIAVSTAAELTDTPVETQIYAAENPKEAPAIVHNHRAQGTGENEWYTPEQHIHSARSVLGGIDLDPATSELANQKVQAEKFFTQSDNGLEQEWHGRVWLNPPYSQPAISQFSEKLASEWESGRIQSAIALTHNYTDTKWFHRLAKTCRAICFTKGRIGFQNPEGKTAAPTQGQAFFYFGDAPEEFAEEFSRHGFVVEVMK